MGSGDTGMAEPDDYFKRVAAAKTIRASGNDETGIRYRFSRD